jgi:hypothetical protein
MGVLYEATISYAGQIAEVYQAATGTNLPDTLWEGMSSFNFDATTSFTSSLRDRGWQYQVDADTEMTYSELVSELDEKALGFRGIGAEKFLEQYRNGTLKNPGEVSELLSLAYLIDSATRHASADEAWGTENRW